MEARRETIGKCQKKLDRATRLKEEQQYRSYVENVQTLNQMKLAFKEVYPSLTNTRKSKKLVNIIMKYEKDIQEYVDNWASHPRHHSRHLTMKTSQHQTGTTSHPKYSTDDRSVQGRRD